ncbi:hypothetical protein TEA_022359 [Camellia sinensis var. sinensis]|uniref:Uncharacterized protein n=1 Tax=Camellia sinensis var. sinensis TaxID=542762 RepID=A0A4S4ER60_CAMSN|nr:hypothetical protein TEA_022359 [Camellia sinensis var. sinensis]
MEERNVEDDTNNNPQTTVENFNQIVHSVSSSSSSNPTQQQQEDQEQSIEATEEAELNRLLVPDVLDLPLTPPSAVDSNFVPYFAPGKSDRSGIKVTGKRKKADREGYIAIMMPKPADWLKAKALLMGVDKYKKLREPL